MNVIFSSVSNVHNICGDQKLLEKDYRLSKHVFSVSTCDGTLLFHTMTGEMILIADNEELKQYEDELIRHWFLVPADFDECKHTDQVRQIKSALNRNKTIKSFTVFTTTDCNARCSYCYELGRKRFHMSDSVALDTAHYISAVSKGENVKITWFGGEPLYNRQVIDIICSELKQCGVTYRCSMASNGYLLNRDVIDKAIKDWNLESVQITLDGTEENYNRIKGYIYNDSSAYERVLDNIDNALAAGIKVCVRLNVDAANQADIRELIVQLGERFGGRTGFSVYHKMLVPFAGKIHEFENDESRTKCYFEIWDLLCKYGFCRENTLKRDIYFQQCMADNDACVTIMPDGSLGKCEHYSESEIIGDIYNGITDNDMVKSWKETIQYPLCKECPLYPRCIHLKKCDWNKIVCDGSDRDIRLERLRRTILKAYSDYRQKEASE